MARGRTRRTKRKTAGPVPAACEQPALQYPRLTHPWILAAIVVAAILAFSAAIDAPFQFDDVTSIPGNPTVQHLSAAMLAPPSGGLAVSGRPVVNISVAINHAIDARLGIDDAAQPAGPHATVSYHVVNLALHLLCGFLLLGIVRRTLHSGRGLDGWRDSADAIALAVTALWLLHPIQTEAVDYIIQRTELLVSLFYAATLYGSIRAWDASSRARQTTWLAASVACCLLGMGSKEVMVSAPLAVVLYDRSFRAASWRDLLSRRTGRLLYYAALVATVAWLAAIVLSGARSTTAGFGTDLSWYRYFYTQAWAITRYVRLLFWPSGLIYDYGQTPVSGLLGVPGLISLAAFGVAAAVAWTRDRWRWFGFVGAWFFLLLGPSSSVVPIRTEIAAERRVYLASAAIIVLVVVGIVAVLRHLALRDTASGRRWAQAAIVACAATALLLASATFERSALYRHPRALWSDTIAKRPANARAYDNLAAVLLQEDSTNTPEAERLFRRSIAVDSTYLPAWTNLADVEMKKGETAEARSLLERVLRIAPDLVDANARLAGVLVKDGEPARAIPMLERVVAARPTDDEYVDLATAYMASGRPDDATTALRRAVALNPGRADAAVYLGAQLAQAGHPDEAMPYLETATRSSGAASMTFALLSLAAAQVGNQTEAIAAANAAAQRAGNDEQVYLALGRAMLILGRTAEAARFFGDAVRVAPDDPEAVTRLGIAAAAGGNAKRAEALFRRALVISPNYPPAMQSLAKLKQR